MDVFIDSTRARFMTALGDASTDELRALELTYAGLSDLAGAHLRDELEWKAAAVTDELQRRAHAMPSV